MKANSHGADIYSASIDAGIDENLIIDFSSNINPLGIPESVKHAIVSSVENACRYPDNNSRELTSKLSVHEKVPREWIFCSNGAAEAIFRIVLHLKPKKALLTAPTFSEYEQALKTVDTEIEYYNLTEESEFKITESIFDSIKSDTDIVFICNPNNPTGQITDKAMMKKIIELCFENNTAVVIDECFLDFVSDKEKYSVNDLMSQYKNLIILKAFTKIYAIPGIRLGYCLCSDVNLTEGFKNSGPPWNVSTFAQAAGVVALEEKEYVKDSVRYVCKQREYLIEELKKLNIKSYESYANYIFLKIDRDINFQSKLLDKGILIRSCSNYRGLSDKYYRIAVKSEYDNRLLIAKLKEIMGTI